MAQSNIPEQPKWVHELIETARVAPAEGVFGKAISTTVGFKCTRCGAERRIDFQREGHVIQTSNEAFFAEHASCHSRAA